MNWYRIIPFPPIFLVFVNFDRKKSLKRENQNYACEETCLSVSLSLQLYYYHFMNVNQKITIIRRTINKYVSMYTLKKFLYITTITITHWNKIA